VIKINYSNDINFSPCYCYNIGSRKIYSNISNYYLSDYRIEEYGWCAGTKEQEECSCGGDKNKCDFYDYIRKQAKEDNLNNKILNAIKFLEENGYKVEKK